MDSLTQLEIYDFCKRLWPDQMIPSFDGARVMDFVAAHMEEKMCLFSRGENGEIRAVLFGWPISTVKDYDGEFVNEPDGPIFYCNLLIVDPEYYGHEMFKEIAETMRYKVVTTFPSVEYYSYHRAKHGDRYALVPIERAF